MAKPRASSPHDARDFAEVAGVLGEALTARLCEYIGGVRTYIPRFIPASDPIVAAIGRDGADKLSEFFHATRIELPRIYLNRARVIALKQQNPKMTNREIALATGYTDRHVRHILADEREDDGQLSLPGF